MFGAYPCGATSHAPTDSYYTDATNYATRIYLAEGATDAEREEVIGQNMGVTLVGMMIGLPLGIWTLGFLLSKLASEYEMRVSLGPLTFIVSILVTAGTSLLVSLLVARRNRKIDMVEALKGAE